MSFVCRKLRASSESEHFARYQNRVLSFGGHPNIHMSADKTSDLDAGQSAVFFKPKVRRAGGLRRRKSSSEDSDDEGSSVKKTERKRLNGMVHRSTVAKKWTPEPEKVVHSFSSSKQKAGPSDQGATATIEIDTELDKDSRAIFERAQKVNAELKGKADDKVYRGINNYAQYIEKKDSAAGSAAKMKAKGPLRAPTNIRSTVRWDYQPDICKDFKETGFCGFGDSCIFMHDRSDYKHGWQMDREWDEKQKKKAQSGNSDEDDDDKYGIPSDDDDLPFACFICREDFENPVSTKCGHFFCEKCALENLKKSNRCFVCAKPTGGIFTPAKELQEKLKQRKAKAGEDEDCPSDVKEHGNNDEDDDGPSDVKEHENNDEDDDGDSAT